MNQKQYVFLAEGLTKGDAAPDAEESDLVVRRVSVADFESMLLEGTIVDKLLGGGLGPVSVVAGATCEGLIGGYVGLEQDITVIKERLISAEFRMGCWWN